MKSIRVFNAISLSQIFVLLKSNTTDVTSGAGTAYSSGAPELPGIFVAVMLCVCWFFVCFFAFVVVVVFVVVVHVAQYLVFCVLCCRSLLVHVWSLYYLYFHVRLLTTPLVSLNFSFLSV